MRFYRYTGILVFLCLIVSVQALASFREPEGCQNNVKLTQEQKLSRADIAFKGYALDKECRCGKAVVHCTTTYKPLENYKNTQMDKIYKIDETYLLDFGCTHDYINDLEKVSEQTKAFFFKQDEGGITRVRNTLCEDES